MSFGESTFITTQDQPMNSCTDYSVKGQRDVEEIDTYFFESDHVALKGNSDYHAMLRNIALLEAQRIQALSDLDQLYKFKEEALKDPIDFVDKLQRGVDLHLPKPQNIPQLPAINWEKYTSSVDFTSLGIPKHLTRFKKQLVTGGGKTSCCNSFKSMTTGSKTFYCNSNIVT